MTHLIPKKRQCSQSQTGIRPTRLTGIIGAAGACPPANVGMEMAGDEEETEDVVELEGHVP